MNENQNVNNNENNEVNDAQFKFLGEQAPAAKKAGTQKSMMRRFAPVIALCCIAAVLLSSVFVLKKVLPSDAENGDEESKTIELFDFIGTAADRLEIDNDLGKYAFVRVLEKTYCVEGKEDLPVNNSRILTALTYVGELEAKTVVDKTPSDLEQYGLADPVSTVTWTRGDQKYVFHIGNQAPSGAYYMMVDGDSAVYTYDTTAAGYFIGPRMEYYDTTLYTFAINADAPYVNKLKIGKKGGDVIEVNYRDVPEDELISAYQMVEPIVHDFSSVRASALMGFISDMTVNTIYDDDLSAENLKKYGLDDPEYTFYFRNVADEHTLYFGKLSDKGYRYMYSPQNDFIYIVDEETVNPITLTIADYCEEISYSRSYDTVDNIIIMGGDKRYECVITGDADDESLEAYINKKHVTYDNFSNLYAHIITIGIKGVGTKPEGAELIATVVFNCLDGTQDVLRYYKKDEMESYYELNGEGRLLVSTANVEQILQYAQDLYDGKEIVLEW